jgi:hypothetical protein
MTVSSCDTGPRPRFFSADAVIDADDAGYEFYFSDLEKAIPLEGPLDPAAIYAVMKKYQTDPATL